MCSQIIALQNWLIQLLFDSMVFSSFWWIFIIICAAGSGDWDVGDPRNAGDLGVQFWWHIWGIADRTSQSLLATGSIIVIIVIIFIIVIVVIIISFYDTIYLSIYIYIYIYLSICIHPHSHTTHVFQEKKHLKLYPTGWDRYPKPFRISAVPRCVTWTGEELRGVGTFPGAPRGWGVYKPTEHLLLAGSQKGGIGGMTW